MNWDQLKTILWLRWRLTRNQSARSGGLGAIVAVLILVGAGMLAVGSFAGTLLGGILGLGEVKPMVIWGIWLGLALGFLFLWLIGLINELQRSESIDLQRLMHLPVALGQIFVINYLASHLMLSVLLLVPAMMGMSIGLAISRGPIMLLLAPLALSMVFMISAWTYCLRGWLATLMSNPRRRRTVIMGITLGFILLAQAPNLYFNLLRRSDRQAKPASGSTSQLEREARNNRRQEKLDQFLGVQKFVPPLWLPAGAHALAEGRVWPALWGTLGGLVLGGLGLRRAYQSTLRFYHGDTGGKAALPIKSEPVAAAAKSSVPVGRNFLERKIPGVPEPAAALALATFRSLLRAPEVKMAWGSSFLVTLIVGGSLLFRSNLNMPDAAKPFLVTGAVSFSIFMLVQFFVNQFGFDRDAFRALILSPTERRLILLGKNLACLPVGLFGLILLIVMAVRFRLSPDIVLATVFQLVTLLLLAGMLGNLLSILVPYRIQPGSMKPTKMPALATLVMVGCHLLFPVMMAPAFVPPLAEWLWQRFGGMAFVPVNLLLSVALAALATLAYWQTLAPLGRMLQRRETKILAVVTVEVE